MVVATDTDSIEAPSTTPVSLSAEQRGRMARKKVTCPFLGSAVSGGELSVRNSVDRPLAAVEDIVALGDSGGGDLGSRVLAIFARGNHSRMVGPSGALDTPTPDGTMSLDLAGSQGAHPGHSGILLGDPTRLDAGRFSAADFERLASRADEHGRLSASAVGEFIAENVARDPRSKVLPIGRLAGDLFGLVDEIGDRRGEGICLGNLGNAYADLGEVERAAYVLRQAKAIGEQIGDPQAVPPPSGRVVNTRSARDRNGREAAARELDPRGFPR